MSGIAGIYYKTAQVIAPTILENMVQSLSHRAKDGDGIWHHDNIGLAHMHWAVTPEAEYEQQPLEVEHIVVTADVRIDNREELIPQLSFPFVNASVITDVDIIAAAYLKWGEKSLSYLTGAFAFAIWDKELEQLFVANDHLGLRTIYYYQNDDLFAFASEINALWDIPGLKKFLNPEKAVIYVVGLDDSHLKDYPKSKQHCETIFQDIFILYQATEIIASKSGLTFSKYWDIAEAAQKIKFDTEEEYLSAFKERFSRAVSCRLRSNRAIGSHLSGGLDSSSITSMACHLSPTTNFNAYHTYTEQTDERRYAQAVVDQYGSQLTYQIVSPSSNIDSVSYFGKLTSEPPTGVHYGVMHAVYQRMQEDGIGVSLSGEGGDEGISHGSYYPMNVLIENGYDAYKKLLLQAHQHPQKSEKIAKARVLGYYNNYLLVPYIFTAKCKWSTKITLLFKAFPDAAWRLVKSILKTGYYLYRPTFFRHPLNTIFNTKYTQKILSKITGPFSSRPYFDNEYEAHLADLRDMGLQIQAESATISHHLNIDLRYPLIDKELLTLCLAVPPSLKWHEGYGRGVLRQSLGGIVPKIVLNRDDKSEFSNYLLHAYQNQAKEKLTDFMHGIVDHEDFVNVDYLKKELLYLNNTKIDKSKAMIPSFRRLHRLLYFYIWKKKSIFEKEHI